MIHFLRMRPLMQIRSSLSADEAVGRLQQALQERGADMIGSFTGRYVILRISESQQHFFSPQLSFEIEPADSGSVLNGLFMPMPSVWTAFMALYGLILFGGFCGAVYGYAQMQLGNPPQALWAVPAALFLLLMVYLAACVGQAMGRAQMEELQRVVEQSLAIEA